MKKRNTDDFEENKLRLALLKENFGYKDFFDEIRDRLPAESARRRLRDTLKNRYGVRVSLLAEHYDDALLLLDPRHDIDDTPLTVQKRLLPALFNEPAVRLVPVNAEQAKEYAALAFPVDADKYDRLAADGVWQVYAVFCPSRIQPHERLLKVDLSKKRADVEREFRRFLDAAPVEADRRRFRAEAWKHLEAWKLYREKRSFKAVARTMKEKLSTVTMRYYRAIELTQGRKYDPAGMKKAVARVRKSEMKITCSVCPQRATCKTLCPEMLRYADQDRVSRREPRLSDLGLEPRV